MPLTGLDTFDHVLLAVLVVMVAAGGYSASRAVRDELAFYRFMREHGFQRSPAVSTMRLARIIEHAAPSASSASVAAAVAYARTLGSQPTQLGR